MSITVCITGAAGQIAQSLIPMLCTGQVFGPDTKINLHLLDISFAMKALGGVVMEIQDCKYKLVKNIEFGDDPKILFKNVDQLVCLGGFPRKPGMERADLLERNRSIYEEQGKILNEVAPKTVKVLLVANPANTNCLVMSTFAKDIPHQNFTCLTKLDENRAKAQIAMKLKENVENISNVYIWGNHSPTMVPDFSQTFIKEANKELCTYEGITDDQLIEAAKDVKLRGKIVMDARGLSSAMSAATGVKDHLIDLHFGSNGSYTSMGIITKNDIGKEQNVENDLCFSFPVLVEKNGEMTVMKATENLLKNENFKEAIKTTHTELIEEKQLALK